MNRRQFTQSLAALFATPVVPAAKLVSATPATTLPSSAYFWADYMTRMHNKCTPDMLAPFFKANSALAKSIHSQLVAENYLTTAGHAHPNLLAKQPAKSFGQRNLNRAHSQPDNPVKSPRPKTMETKLEIRQSLPEDHDVLTEIWHTGWIEAHAEHVPSELTVMRTKDSFHTRLSDMLDTTLVAGPIGKPIGFCAVRDDEIYQMYVSPAGRGTGAASALITAGCDAIHRAGHQQATLDVIPQNSRAIAFYDKMGWISQGTQHVSVDTLAEPFVLPCVVMTKNLEHS